MTDAQALANRIATHIRKSEDLQDILKKTSKLLAEETKCLHNCLNEALALADMKSGEISAYSGGQPKDKL